MITDSTKITIGSRPYKVTASHNLRDWEKIVASLHHEKKTGHVCASVYFVERQGVRRDFINYAVRNNFLSVVTL